MKEQRREGVNGEVNEGVNEAVNEGVNGEVKVHQCRRR